MKKLYTIFLLILIFSVRVEGQEVTWQRYYNYYQGFDEAHDAIQTFDGGYLVVGRGRSSSSYLGAFLLKLDYLGNIEWKKLIGNPEENKDPYKVRQDSDSGYIIVGESYNSFLIFKTDKNGEVIWDKRYSENNSEARGRSFIITDDKYIISSGTVYFFSPLVAYPYIIKTDLSGNLIWKKYFKDMTNISAHDIIEIENKEYIFCGSEYLRKIDSSGNVISTNSYWSGSGFLSLFELAYEYPGIIYCGGTSSNGEESFHLLKVNSDDSLYWNKRIFYKGSEIADGSSICLSNGNVFMTGVYNMKGVIPFVKVSSDGDLLIYNLIPESQSVESYALSIRPTNDNGFIISGSTRFGATPSYKYLVIKTDSNGYAPELVNIQNQIENIEQYELFQNYPNPFNPVTTINFSIPRQGNVTLKVYDVTGKAVKTLINEQKAAGNYTVSFSATSSGNNLPSGAYFYRLESGEFKEVKRMILVK